ncbi:hypothetical protein [Candidatus Poriferisocius sp.]|uniref:hypothetical protein n=1 Tax=Candidatus Poriferisocius sp. TaxID=3101276 RepID=UPI003B013FBA
MSKERVTITVEVDLLNHAKSAVETGVCRSVSEWICEAMAEQMAKDARLVAMDELIADFEAEYGPITDEEIAEQVQLDRDASAAWRLEGERKLAAWQRQQAAQQAE